MVSTLVRRVALATGTLAAAGVMTALMATPASAHPIDASNEGFFTSSTACYKAEARIEENYNVRWAGCENPSGTTWILWVQW